MAGYYNRCTFYNLVQCVIYNNCNSNKGNWTIKNWTYKSEFNIMALKNPHTEIFILQSCWAHKKEVFINLASFMYSYGLILQ